MQGGIGNDSPDTVGGYMEEAIWGSSGLQQAGLLESVSPLMCFIEWERKDWNRNILSASITMFGEKNMRSTLLWQSTATLCMNHWETECYQVLK